MNQTIVLILLIASVVCFVLEAFGMAARVKWWALGAAFWVASQLPL